MIIVLVYFKDWSIRMPIYAWDELNFFKGSYLIRITQCSRKVIHRKRLFKEITCYCKKDRLLKTKRKLFPDQSREQIFTGLSDRYAENIVGPAWFLPVRSDGLAYFDMSVYIYQEANYMYNKLFYDKNLLNIILLNL